MKIRNLLIAVMIVAAGNVAMAKKDAKQPDSYAYTRGMECLNEGDVEKALEWFQKEINDNPKNGYAYFMISTIYEGDDQHGRAMTEINKAIKLIPSKDNEWSAAALGVRSDINLAMGDTIKALDDLAQAQKINPENGSFYGGSGTNLL